MVGDLHLAGKELGHAGRIEIDDEAVQLDGERQVLDQHAVLARDDGRIAACAFRNEHVAAKRRIAEAQPVLRRDLGNHAITGERRLSIRPFLEADTEIGVEQSAYADDDDCAVGKNIAPLVGSALLGGDQRRLVLLHDPDPITMRAYPLGRLLNQLRLVLRAPPFGLVMEIAQRLFAHVLAPAAHVGQHARRIAHDA